MFFVSIHASFRLMISKANLRLADISGWVVLVMMAENCVLLPPVSHTKSFILSTQVCISIAVNNGPLLKDIFQLIRAGTCAESRGTTAFLCYQDEGGIDYR